MKTPTLSILTPTIPGRESQLKTLHQKICSQARRANAEDRVEHLILSDNRMRSIGGKRQALLDIARGEYVAFVDDDDDINDEYVSELLRAAETGADVITFKQEAFYNGLRSVVSFGLRNQDGPFTPGETTIRGAWHVCAWRRAVVTPCRFLEVNYGEDKAWAVQARQRAKTTIHIPLILHVYRHDAATTAAPEPAAL